MINSYNVPNPGSSLERWWIVILLLTTFSLGCMAEKESLHEMDHELPPHWPANMEDAAQKIEQRLSQIEVKESAKTTREELSDLIEWAPEIAADTELPELDWMPIYERSETLRRHFSAGDISLDECLDDLKRFVVLLRESQAMLPKPKSDENFTQ